MATVIYGSEVSIAIKNELKNHIDQLYVLHKRIPKLVVILIGNHPASMSYVKGKQKACEQVGMLHEVLHFDEDISQDEVMKQIEELNNDETVDGILVQLPLPKHLNEQEVLQKISYKKDVDGFHPFNIGKAVLQEEDTFLSCTPKGVIRLLESIGYDDLSGMHAVVVGRSNIVGKPMAQLLLGKNATITICHSKTKDIEMYTKHADIVIVAVGKAKFMKKEWIKDGAIVIDVGINRLEDGSLCGDVDFEEVKQIASYITPVPKGVGPMTIAMLLENTWESYKRRSEEGVLV